MDPIPSGTTEERVERLLRDAHLLRMRQQWAHAETLCRQALELAPEDALGQELLADLLAEKGETEEALEMYRKCLERQPGKGSLEEKIARLVLQKEAEERERLEAQLLLNNPKQDTARKRSATIALMLSLLCPGAGQIFNGETVKGGVVLVVGLVCLYFGVPELIKFVMGLAAPAAPGGGARTALASEAPSGPLALLGLVGLLLYIYSLIDAASTAGKSGRKVSV